MARAKAPVVLPDPEMALPDEKLPPHDAVKAVSQLFGGEYRSLKDMIFARTIVETELGKHITEEQRAALVPGCWAYFEISYDSQIIGPRGEANTKVMPVFGEIPDIEDLLKSERQRDAKFSAQQLLRRRVSNAHNRGWLFGKANGWATDGAR
jgi:hypothetical protein